MNGAQIFTFCRIFQPNFTVLGAIGFLRLMANASQLSSDMRNIVFVVSGLAPRGGVSVLACVLTHRGAGQARSLQTPCCVGNLLAGWH
jgi:hypothetical protein